jgi:SAM-dependent methyltransferase
VANAAFVQGDAARLPFRTAAFDLVFSHSVIEHVASAEDYLRECYPRAARGRRALPLHRPTLSLAGAHLPRLLVPVPLHLLVGRRASSRRSAGWPGTPPGRCRSRRRRTPSSPWPKRGRRSRTTSCSGDRAALRAWIEGSGFRSCARTATSPASSAASCPGPAARLEATPFTQDVMIGHIQCVLQKP